jgi:autotransporter-associated beta strand protein
MKHKSSQIQTCFVRATKVTVVALAIIVLKAMGLQAQTLFWNTNGVSASWTISNWGASADGPFTNAWTANSDVEFTTNSTLTFATTSIGNVTVDANQTVAVAAGGTVTFGASGTGGLVRVFDIGSGATLNWVSQTISANSSAGITKNGDGILNLGALTWNTAMTGGFTLNDGTVIVSGAKAFGNGAMTINGGTIQSSGGKTWTPTSLAIGGDFTFAGTGNDTWGMPTDLGAATRNITDNTTSGSRVFSGLISADADGVGINFLGNGAGQIYIGNSSNTYSGLITITGTNGTPEVGFASDGSLGAIPDSVITNAIVVDGGRLTSSDTSGNAVTNTFNSNRGIQVGATLGTSISVAKSAGLLIYNGVIADEPGSAGILAKQGAGILSLGGVSTYSGDTFINNGTVQLTNGDNRLPTGTVINLGQSASANLGTFDLNGNNQEIAGIISVSGNNANIAAKNIIINSATNAATLTISGSNTYAYGDGSANNSGIIAGNINLVINGSGIQTLGDTNTYTGNTTVNAGTLALSGTGSIADTPEITVAAGATVDVSARTDGTLTLASGQTLDGFGTVNGIVAATGGSIVAPGSPSTTGMLTVSSNVTLNGTTVMKLDKSGETNDVLSVGGTLTYGGILNVTNLSGTLAAGDTFSLFNAVSNSASFSITNLPPLDAGLAWTNNGSGTWSVVGVSSPISYLAINNFSLSGTDLVFGGTNQGTGTYYVLASTNLTLPLTNWTAIATNVLTESGNFTFTATNIVDTNAAQEFYILGTTNND